MKATSMNPVKVRAIKLGWLAHNLYREADAYVSGYETAMSERTLAWQDKLIHDLIVYWVCEGVTQR